MTRQPLAQGRGNRPFSLVLRLHTPVILPFAAPRLDILLQEALSRLHQDWNTQHDLPLAVDEATGVYCASQLIFGVTPRQPLSFSQEEMASAVLRQDIPLTGTKKAKFSTSGPDGNKMSCHHGILAPYALFHARGDAQRCAELFTMLSGIGREHARHYGSFQVARLDPLHDDGWRLRPWPADHPAGWAGCNTTFHDDHLSLRPRSAPVAVKRPPRLLREVL